MAQQRLTRQPTIHQPWPCLHSSSSARLSPRCCTCSSSRRRTQLSAPCIMKGGRGSISYRAVNQARVAGGTKGRRRGSTRRHGKPGCPEPTPENRANIMKRGNIPKQPMSGNRLAMAAGFAAPFVSKDPSGTRYDGAATSCRNPSVPAHRRASWR